MREEQEKYDEQSTNGWIEYLLFFIYTCICAYEHKNMWNTDNQFLRLNLMMYFLYSEDTLCQSFMQSLIFISLTDHMPAECELDCYRIKVIDCLLACLLTFQELTSTFDIALEQCSGSCNPGKYLWCWYLVDSEVFFIITECCNCREQS